MKNIPINAEWRIPAGEVPDGAMLVEFDKSNGESDVALVYISDEDNQTLICAGDEFNGNVYTGWDWESVSRYVLLEDLLVKDRDGGGVVL